MADVNLSQLAELTGKTWRTVRGRLQAAGVDPSAREGRIDLFDSVVALAAIYEVERAADDALDLSAERAALARAQRLRIETAAAIQAGDLRSTRLVVQEVSDMLAAFRSRLLALPGEIAQVLPQADAARVVSVVRAKLHEALTEIAEYKPTPPTNG